MSVFKIIEDIENTIPLISGKILQAEELKEKTTSGACLKLQVGLAKLERLVSEIEHSNTPSENHKNLSFVAGVRELIFLAEDLKFNWDKLGTCQLR